METQLGQMADDQAALAEVKLVAYRQMEDVTIPEHMGMLVAAEKRHLDTTLASVGCLTAMGCVGWRIYSDVVLDPEMSTTVCLSANHLWLCLTSDHLCQIVMITIALLALNCAWCQISLACSRVDAARRRLYELQQQSLVLHREYEQALRASQPERREMTLVNATRFGLQRLATRLWG